jgi:hypothetical protein
MFSANINHIQSKENDARQQSRLARVMTVALLHYDAMCREIAEAHRMDEVKDISDKALALEIYARQALNTEAEDRCREIRQRAERKWGTRVVGGPIGRTLRPIVTRFRRSKKWE